MHGSTRSGADGGKGRVSWVEVGVGGWGGGGPTSNIGCTSLPSASASCKGNHASSELMLTWTLLCMSSNTMPHTHTKFQPNSACKCLSCFRWVLYAEHEKQATVRTSVRRSAWRIGRGGVGGGGVLPASPSASGTPSLQPSSPATHQDRQAHIRCKLLLAEERLLLGTVDHKTRGKATAK